MKRVFLLATDYWLLPVIIRRLCLFILALLLPSAPAGAKDSPRLAPDLSRYEGRTVESVEVAVEDASVDEAGLAEFRSRIRVVAGRPFSAVLVRESLQNLFETRRVADARVEARDVAAGAGGQPRVALRFVIRPQVVVAGVTFEIGADFGAEITEDELRSRVTLLEPGKRLSDQLLKENADAVAAYLRDRGFYRAEVSYSQQLDPTRTRATVLFNVRPGPPTTVGQFNINIKGFDNSKGFDPAAVERGLKLQAGTHFSQAA